MIKNVGWNRVAGRIERYWQPKENNPHMGFLAPSRSGKSYLIRWGILPIAWQARVVLIDVKLGGEKTWADWGNDVTEIKPGFSKGADGTANYRVMLEPGERGKHQVKRVLDIVQAEGECILVMDDSRKITANAPSLGLSGNVDEILTDGAGIGITVILAANSTVWATSSLRDQCGIYFLGKMRNRDEARKFANIAGLNDPDELDALQRLGRRQFLYSDLYDGDMTLAITGIPER